MAGRQSQRRGARSWHGQVTFAGHQSRGAGIRRAPRIRASVRNALPAAAQSCLRHPVALGEKGVKHQKPERPFGCFALLVPDTFFPGTFFPANPNLKL